MFFHFLFNYLFFITLLSNFFITLLNNFFIIYILWFFLSIFYRLLHKLCMKSSTKKIRKNMRGKIMVNVLREHDQHGKWSDFKQDNIQVWSQVSCRLSLANTFFLFSLLFCFQFYFVVLVLIWLRLCCMCSCVRDD